MKLTMGGKILVGFDLCDDYSQISFTKMDSEEVETVSSVTGEEVFNIPTALCKKEGTNQWLYGSEALRFAEEEQGILVENLVSLAVCGEPIQIEGNSYQPESLLALFFKRALTMLSQATSTEKIAALMITCKNLDDRMIAVLSSVVEGLKLKAEKTFFQSHGESFYHYMLYQPEELRRMENLLLEYKGSSITVYHMDCNRRTTPMVVHINEGSFPFTSYEPMEEEEALRREKQERLDEEFLHLLQSVCENKMLSAVYLIGEHFSEEWMKESLRYLCKGRRVFQGNNLYSKGAVYSLLERMCPSEAGQNHVFLGQDKLKTNVGMRIQIQGEENYYALLDAGVNWYETEECVEFYLHEGNVVELMLTSLIGGSSRVAQVALEGLPEGICRLRMHLYLKSEKVLMVEVEDLGFGVFRPTEGLVWKEEIELENT